MRALRVKVKFYAMYKDVLGEERTFDLPEGSKAKDLKKEILKLLPEGFPEPVLLKGNSFLSDDAGLSEGDEVDAVPPAAGGEGRVILTEDEDFSVDKAIEGLAKPDTGAIVVFVGTVKSKGGKVKELIYEAHPSLKEIMEKIVDEVVKAYKAHDARVVQFLGPRRVGQKTLIIAVSAEDRDTAFNAARELLERLKHEPPIWKREVRADGEYWIAGDKEIRRG